LAWTGFDFHDELPDVARKCGVPLEQAASIAFVYPGSPADQAGLRAYDTITKIDGEIVKSVFWLMDRLYSRKVGDSVVLEVARGDRRQQLTLTTVDFPPDKVLLQGLIGAAEADNPQAQASLGIVYAMGGYGVPVNGEKALYWLTKAAANKDARTLNAIGGLYDKGWGVPEDDSKAAEWYRRAVELDYPSAQNNLGSLYLFGTGVEEDEAEAIKLFRRAAEQGDSTAKSNLGLCYLNGWGVDKNEARARELLREAAAAGNHKAIDKLRDLGIDPAPRGKADPTAP
jgi:hypothetical protein